MTGNNFSEGQLKKLKGDLKSSRRQAYAEGSQRNLRIQLETFLLFCIYFGFSYLPVQTETLSLYAQFLSRSFKSTQSIKNYLSGVKTMHLLLGYSTDHINEFLINLGLKGIARSHPHLVKQARAITPEILLKLFSYLDVQDPFDATIWCLFLFAFFLFARKSNLVPNSKKEFKSGKFLRREDVYFQDDILLVIMRWSKTNQFGQRVLKIPLLRIPGSVLCPVTAYLQMCKLIRAKSDDPLFVLPHKKVVTYKIFQVVLKDLISKIGLDAQEFSSHSFRRGGTTFAFQSRVPTDLIKLHGDWKSDCYQKYLSCSLEDKLLVVAKMKENLIQFST